MTTENQTTKEKQVPNFYIFEAIEGGEKKNKIVGSIYLHKSGGGQSILLNGKRYAAFAPKAKPAAQAEQSVQPAEGEGA
jgi:hypothetical protein